MIEEGFSYGVTSMARNCLSAVALVRKGRWTLDDMEKWLTACIENDGEYLKAIAPEIAYPT